MRVKKKNIIPFPLVFISIITAALSFLGILLDSFVATNPDRSNDDDEYHALAVTYVIATMCILNDDMGDDNVMDRPAKCHCYNYNYTHVKAAVWKDYLCPYPLFDDKQFQQIFHVSKRNL